MSWDRLTCFLLGHRERMGDFSYEADWCARCYCEWPQEKYTIPRILNMGYVWLIEHSRLFVRFDDWLLKHDRIDWFLPSWWEY